MTKIELQDIAAVLAGEEQTMSLPAVELQIRNLQERQLELFQLIVSAGADCTDYDEELQQVNIAKTRLMAQKAELEKEQRGAAAFESRLAELDMALEQASGTLTDFDELTVRQLVSNIKVLDKDTAMLQTRLKPNQKYFKKERSADYIVSVTISRRICLAYFHIVWKQEGCYYCSEFVGELLTKSRVDGTEQLRSSIIQPMQFLRMPHTLLYRGKLREYMCDTCSEGICEDAANRTVHRRLP